MIEIDMETVPSGAVRILIVEDEILIRLMVVDALRDFGGALVISAATPLTRPGSIWLQSMTGWMSSLLITACRAN